MRLRSLPELLVFLLLFPLSVMAAGSAVDLAEQDSGADLTRKMLALEVEPDQALTPEQALQAASWVLVQNHMRLLKAPRRQSEIWLQVELENSQAMPLQRWLELTPWRAGHIEAWMLEPDTGQAAGYWQTGAGVSVAERDIKSTRAIIPVALDAGERAVLLLKVRSSHRPDLSVISWNSLDFALSEQHRYQRHSIFLAVILTLFVVLLLQHNLHYFLLGCWMLALFALEAEKEGYISYLFFSELTDIGINLRFISSLLEKSLFLIITVYFMELRQHHYWRWVPLGALSVTATASAAGFALNGVELRQLISVMHLVFVVLWLLMLPAALRMASKWRWPLLGLLTLSWLASTLYILSYTLNIQYTSNFASFWVGIKILVILGLLLIYALQKRDYERMLECQLREHTRAEHDRLERAVAQRTCELNQALESVRRADQARTGFLSRVTHDLKSPLTSIMGYSQLLSGERGKAGQMSHIIHNSASHMLNLINRLIDYARDVTAVEAVDNDLYLHAFMNSVTYEARVLSGRNGNHFTLESDPALPAVIRCDETLLREVLLNLLENASKYTRNGTIRLRLQGEKVNQPGGKSMRLICEVEDTGCGIATDQQDQLFEPFFRASEQGEGVGLGLSIVKELVERMGGEVSLSSVQGEGTCVRFSIPVEPGQEDAGFAVLKTPEQMLPRYHAGGRTAWVVEDAPSIRELLQLELTELGFRVALFSDAESAMQALYKQGVPDLILTDHRLPGASGDSVLDTARAIDPRVPVLLLSATWYLQADQRAQSRSTQQYTALLGKPVDLVRLRREIASACGLQNLSRSPDTAQDPSGSETLPVLDHATLEQLALWLELGAVTDIVEWSEQFGRQHPEQASLATELSRLAERGDFRTIRERLQALPAWQEWSNSAL